MLHSIPLTSRLRLFFGLALFLGLAGCQDAGLDLGANARRVSVGPTVPVAIESLEGAPQDVSPRLSAALAAAAELREISFVDSDKAPRFRLRGYFSAAPAEGGTAVSFVWDLFDQGQKRAQRVSGSELVRRSAADPWQAVDEAGLRRVAARSMDEIAEFLVGIARPESPVANRRPAAPSASLTPAQ